ncbi:protein of unknown function [Rhodovastum atsumiense]|nr:protein of unknown function [Rhodovastum atsumiense]
MLACAGTPVLATAHIPDLCQPVLAESWLAFSVRQNNSYK